MTAEEKRDYQKLAPKYRNYYDFQQSLHPQWSHFQLMNRVAFQIKIDGFIDDGGNVDPVDPDFWKTIIGKVDQWFSTTFPNLYNKVRDVFSRISAELSDMIKKGIKVIGDFLERLLNMLN